MDLIKDINGEDEINTIYIKINEYLAAIEAWLCTITPYKYVFKKIISNKLWPE
jgi:hypothetical protein